MGVYRGMDVGTAKATPAERAEVPHHLLDLVEPHEEFSLTRFQAAAAEALDAVAARGRTAVLVGGTGLYLQAVVDGLTPPGRWPEVHAALDADPDTAALHRRLAELDPVAAHRMEPGNRRRVLRALEVCVGSGRPFSSFGPGLGAYPPRAVAQVGLRRPRGALGERVEARLAAQLDAGFLDEVARLDARPEGWSRTAAQALGYRELRAHLRGELGLAEAVAEAVRRTRRFAIRQERWFRRDPRIAWVDVEAGSSPEDVLAATLNTLAAASERMGAFQPCA
jgi:tRNA dimethylallyltransferase